MQNITVSHKKFSCANAGKMLFAFLLFSQVTMAQQPFVNTSDTKQAAQSGQSIQEKLFVHTDKNYYLAGEILWLKLYNLDAVKHTPATISKVAYVELLDANNKPLLQTKLALEDGLGKGALQLPLDVETGTYRLRVYTNWMKNCGEECFFQKNVTILNTLRGTANNVSKVETSFNLAFFPEGGNLVTGVENKVAFKATGAQGKGLFFTGILLNDKGDSLATITPAHRGMGSFTFNPKEGEKYKAVLTLPNGSIHTRELPAAADRGYAMQLTPTGDKRLKLSVQQKGTGQDGATVYLAATTNNQVKAATQAAFNNNMAVMYIDPALLDEGISKLTLFDNNRQPIAERLYFKKPEKSLQLEAVSNAATYDSRKKVNITIQAKDEKAIAQKANLSMSVYLLDSMQQWGNQTINEYLWLTSELKGIIEAPEYYLQNATAEAAQAADLLMLTHGWRRFSNSATNESKSKASFTHPMEYDGHIVKGIVRSLQTGQPAAGIQTYLSVPGSNIQLYTSRSNKEGMVQFNVKNYFGAGVVVLQINTETDSMYQVQLLSPFAESYSTTSAQSMAQLPAQLESSLVNGSIGMQVQNIYHADSLLRYRLRKRDSLPFYGTPNNSYLLDEYTRFTTMEEVLREYVREINVRKRGGQYQMIVYNEPEQLFFRDNSLIMVDGVPLFNQSSLFSYNPLKVKKLEVVTRRYFVGHLTFNGIASFTTHTGNFEGLELNPRAVIIDYEGLQQQREFYAPAYETEAQLLSRLPDFRNVLHWEPQIKYDGTGQQQVSFFTSDRKGKYRVVIQGVSNDGYAGATSFDIEVK